jgi:protocatechuate 3,4-dioxygenase beta subunit
MVSMKFAIFFTFVFCIICSSNSFAAKTDNETVNLNKLNFCKITKQAENNYEPENFETTNNLLREAGQESLYCGEKIIISGVVVDQNCVPVSDAKVYIWQINCKGKYPYKPLKNDINEKLIDINKILTFTGNGVATTNNKGEFHFITVYPPAIHNIASHVNIRVEHRTIGRLQTRLMLKGHKIESPEYYPELRSIYEVASKKNIGIYNYQIVMPGNSEDNY